MVIGLNEQEGSANAVSGPDRHTTAESGVQVTGIKNPNTGMRNLYGKMSVGV